MSKILPVIMNCNINKEKFLLKGNVKIFFGEGYCSAKINFDRNNIPKGFQPEILSYVAITGYPSSSLSEGNAVNPFLDPCKDFIAHRTINIPEIGKLSTKYYTINRGTADEVVEFNISGNTHLEENIVKIYPLSEIWYPTEYKNKFEGSMTFTWGLSNNKVISGFAKGSYEIESKYILEDPQMRVITFDLKTHNNYFIQKETIRLYNLKEWELFNKIVA